jgi:acyl carrier protein
MTVDEVKQNIREKFKRALGVDLKNDEQHFFVEAGVDSLAFLNLVKTLEKEYEIKFPNDMLPDLANCALLAAAVVDLASKKKALG